LSFAKLSDGDRTAISFRDEKLLRTACLPLRKAVIAIDVWLIDRPGASPRSMVLTRSLGLGHPRLDALDSVRVAGMVAQELGR
jgi:hypothetical protein